MKYADGYEGVTVAGLAVVRGDGSKAVFLTRRAPDPTDDPEVAETWEFPGGHLDVGEDPFSGAEREFGEEVGFPLPEGEVLDGWRSEDGHYQCFVYEAYGFPDIRDWQPTDEVQEVGWFDQEQVEAGEMPGGLRPEVAKTDWSMIFGVSGNEEQGMDEASEYASIDVPPLPVHGVVAPEETETGDRRGFTAGAMTRRPLRLPLRDTATDVGGHDGAYVVGSVDRLMRKDGLIHWEGSLMPSEGADHLTGKMQFFDGRYGVSVDGDKASLDKQRMEGENALWFDSIRASGLTAVDIPAFHEAHVAFGNHPGMPEDNDAAALAASGFNPANIVGARQTFNRGPGWVTDPVATNRIHDYWTKPGQEGYAKIGWGTPGDFRRAKTLIGAKIAQHSPDKVRFLNQIIAQWHFDALGYWPGDLGKPGNAPDTPENRRRAAEHAASRSTHLALVDSVEREDIEVVTDEGEETAEWEAVLVSSAVSGNRPYPPLSYFHRPEIEDGAVNLYEADEHGFVRVTGYAAEWGVCHIGMSGKCVEPPETGSDDYFGFHKGRTKTEDGYVYTGVLTYGVEHRDAKTILSESADKAFFENLKNAWAAVRVGEDERGIWFSGVVLPTVPPEDLVAIEASGQVSGEWLYDEMRACLTVNVRGFAVERPSAEYDDNGNVIALAASAFNSLSPTGGDCPASAEDRMAALRLIDAEVRFARLRMEYLIERSG